MKKKSDLKCIIALALTIFASFFAIWTFTGNWFWLTQPYNSYILQAQAWCDGRLSLSENYQHLELAVFNGGYYVSFPPFPSILMLPFVAIGFFSCDGFIAIASAIAGAVYAFKIFRHFSHSQEHSMLFALLLTIGSNWLFTSQVAWVWFIAQNLAFTLSLMAIYYALKKKSALSLALWACAVGCRPLDALYLPIILYLLYDRDLTLVQNIKSRWKSLIPMAIIAISYMALNFARFKNPFEFGHNYLPEFTEAKNGQFSIVYMAENIKTLFRLPKISFSGKWEYQAFNGTNIFIVSPIFLAFIAYTAFAFIKKFPSRKVLALAVVIIAIELLCTTAHKTMGGSQFGNRYTNDVLPLAFLCIAYALPRDNKYDIFNIILLVFGFAVNLVGSVLYYLQ